MKLIADAEIVNIFPTEVLDSDNRFEFPDEDVLGGVVWNVDHIESFGQSVFFAHLEIFAIPWTGYHGAIVTLCCDFDFFHLVDHTDYAVGTNGDHFCLQKGGGRDVHQLPGVVKLCFCSEVNSIIHFIEEIKDSVLGSVYFFPENGTFGSIHTFGCGIANSEEGVEDSIADSWDGETGCFESLYKGRVPFLEKGWPGRTDVVVVLGNEQNWHGEEQGKQYLFHGIWNNGLIFDKDNKNRRAYSINYYMFIRKEEFIARRVIHTPSKVKGMKLPGLKISVNEAVGSPRS
jgi:hypothetical protein